VTAAPIAQWSSRSPEPGARIKGAHTNSYAPRCILYAPVLAALLIRAHEERGRITGGSARAALTAAWIPCRERLITPVSSCGTDSRGGADDRSGQHSPVEQGAPPSWLTHTPTSDIA